MNDEMVEIYNMLSLEREDVKKTKEDFEKDITVLLNRVKSFHPNRIDIRNEYDLENNFNRFQIDDSFINYKVSSDTLDFKIALLQNYLQDLFIEKKFNDFKKQKEEKMNKNDYLEYLSNPTYRGDMISKWYHEFMED